MIFEQKFFFLVFFPVSNVFDFLYTYFFILFTSTAVPHNEARQSLLSCRAASAVNGHWAKRLKQHVCKDGQMLRHWWAFPQNPGKKNMLSISRSSARTFM